jgi:hypothetical protein
MPKASKATADETVEIPGYEGHLTKLEGGYTAVFERYLEDTDLSPFFSGLPNEQCQSAHWGYVFKGKVGFRYGDHEETFEEGDAYYVPPGHTPVMYAGTEIVEFSPTDELARTIEVVTRNMEAASG